MFEFLIRSEIFHVIHDFMHKWNKMEEVEDEHRHKMRER